MSDPAVVFLVLGVIVVLFVWNRRPVEIVAIGASLTLAATGVLTLGQSLFGFGDVTVVFIAALFVVSEAIEAQPGVVSVRCPSDNPKRQKTTREDKRRNPPSRTGVSPDRLVRMVA